MKIRTRLILMFLVVVALSFSTLVVWITDELGPRHLATMEESLVDTATVLASSLETHLVSTQLDCSSLRDAFQTAHRRELSANIFEITKDRIALRVYVTDTRGIVVFDSDDGRDEGEDYSRWNDVILTLRGEYGARTTPSFSDNPEDSTLYVASPVTMGGEIVGALTVCKSSKSVLVFLETARRQVTYIAILAALGTVVLSIAVSFWVAGPIEGLTRYARAVRDGQRIATPKLGNSEIGHLAKAFEEMRDTLEGKQYADNYVQTLTHQMKSPLSAIRGAAELLHEEMPPEQRARFIENIRGESGRIQDLVDRLLQLASLETRKGLHDLQEMDLTDLLQEVVENANPLLCASDVGVTVEEEEPLLVTGERFLVRQAFANLFQNAIDFSPRGSTIRISFQKRGTEACVLIQDEGPGIPDYALDKVFDRFYSLRRPATGRKSSGLGLTFVREVALLHGGSVTLENAPAGGALATITFPSPSGSPLTYEKS